MKSYDSLASRFARISKLNHVLSIVGWDEQVNMPEQSGESRAQAMAECQIFAQEMLLDPRLEDEISKAKTENLEPLQRANLSLMEKQIRDAKAIPTELNHALSLATMQCQQAWRELRAKNDWGQFSPLLETVVKLTREQAQCRGQAFSLSPYDALLDRYQEGVSKTFIDQIFSDLKTWLPDLIQKTSENTKPFVKPKGPFAVSDQKKLGMEVMKNLGFDFSRGRLDVSHHPFCGGVSTDVRMTTRYSEADFSESFMGIVHETGHGCYEQGLPRDFEFQPVGQSCGMMVHESQSLLFEMQIGRSKTFLKFLTPLIQKYFGGSPALSLENLEKLYCHVSPGLIRVDADEVTYPAHVILRYEIEKDLIEGRLAVGDIPEVWDEKMTKYLGLSTKGDYKDGCLQDVHWPSGAFGYFPCYTLGAMLAAQLFRTIKIQNPSVEAELSRGDMQTVSRWLSTHVWSKGSSLHPMELVRQATGEALNPSFYRSHLEVRYLS